MKALSYPEDQPIKTSTPRRIRMDERPKRQIVRRLGAPGSNDAWLRDVIPGAREAFDRYEEFANDPESARLSDAVRDAIRARHGKVRGTDENGRLRPAPGVSVAEADELADGIKQAERAANARARQASALLDEYHQIMSGRGDFTEAKIQQLAAAHALAKNDEAAAAWGAFRHAIGARDSAWDLAGRPGRDWSDIATGLSGDPYHDRDRAETLLAKVVGDFDTRAVRAVAEGVAE